jgi:SAM-dependent methyltransferase
MDKEFWNERYGREEYAYGINPNPSLAEALSALTPGKILFPAEGEGRNAVFAAKAGWNVHAFDISEAGKTKSNKLAALNNVSINYSINSFENYDGIPEYFDCIALIFTHISAENRKDNFQRILKFLKPGGTLILIGFSKNQFGKKSGGPKNAEMLFSEVQLKKELEGLHNIEVKEFETDLTEGSFHAGYASLIQLTAIK